MTNKKNTEKVDRAWELLYNRLEKDGLLPEDKVSVHSKFLQPSLYKWTAVLAAACILGIIMVTMFKTGPEGSLANLTLVNEERDANLVATLEDGSVVYLVQQSSLSFPEHFENEKREVNLKGEAFFDINKHEGKPFIVETDLVYVEVLGTAFNIVNTDEVPFSLSVLRGKVRVVNKKDGGEKIVESGQMVFWDNGKIKTSDDFDFGRFDIYMNNLHFKDERLSNIIRIINAKSDSVKITLSPELEGRLLNVTFREETPVTMVELICLALNLQYEQTGNTIFISKNN